MRPQVRLFEGTYQVWHQGQWEDADFHVVQDELPLFETPDYQRDYTAQELRAMQDEEPGLGTISERLNRKMEALIAELEDEECSHECYDPSACDGYTCDECGWECPVGPSDGESYTEYEATWTLGSGVTYRPVYPYDGDAPDPARDASAQPDWPQWLG